MTSTDDGKRKFLISDRSKIDSDSLKSDEIDGVIFLVSDKNAKLNI